MICSTAVVSAGIFFLGGGKRNPPRKGLEVGSSHRGSGEKSLRRPEKLTKLFKKQLNIYDFLTTLIENLTIIRIFLKSI